MSKVFDLGNEDEGFIEFTYKGITVTIDVFEVLRKISLIKENAAQFDEKEVFWVDEVKEYLESVGLSGLSNAKVLTVIRILMKSADGLPEEEV
jgi:saccharopine dehydrogenase-like NADP-dependent oxidoreductase